MNYKEIKGKKITLNSGRTGIVTGKELYDNEIFLLLDNETEAKADAGIDYVTEIHLDKNKA